MSGLDVILIIVFASVWLVPTVLAVRWESSNRRLRHELDRTRRTSDA